MLFYPIRYDFLHVFLQNLKHVLFFPKTPYYDDHQIFNIEKKICKSYFEAQISRFSRFFALFTKVVLAKKTNVIQGVITFFLVITFFFAKINFSL